MRRSWGCIGSLAALAALAMPVPASAQSGGPDAFGYEFSPASFDFVALDLVGGTPLGLGDDEEADVTLPWAFPFYGVDYSEITVSANGSVRTVTSTVNPADYALQHIPKSTTRTL